MTPEITIRAVLTDVDNTILANDSLDLPTPRISAALREANERMPVGWVTARQLQKVKHLDRLRLSGLSAVSNGAQIFDTEKKEMVVERVMDPLAVMTIAEELKRLGIPYWIQDDGIDQVISDTPGTDTELKKYTTLDTYKPGKPFVMVGSGLQQDAVDAISVLVKTGFPQLTSFSAHRHGDGTTDLFIADQKTNKADAVVEIAERLGIDPQEILAIGDGLNDIPFLKTCGIAVAVGNAVPEVKAIADHVVSSWDKDGVAEAVDVFVLKKHQQKGKFV